MMIDGIHQLPAPTYFYQKDIIGQKAGVFHSVNEFHVKSASVNGGAVRLTATTASTGLGCIGPMSPKESDEREVINLTHQ